MKRCCATILLLTCFCINASADHITGGEMYYTYSGFSNGLHHYNVTLKLFMRCNSGRNLADPTIISVFDRASNNRIIDITVPLAQELPISLPNPGPCITKPPTGGYKVGYYNFLLSFPSTSSGYLLASQVNTVSLAK